MRLALTMGDPRGIGAEIILKALAHPSITPLLPCLTIFGDRQHLYRTYHQLQSKASAPLCDPQNLAIRQVGNYDLERQAGSASFAYLEEAIAATLAGEFAGIITAPIAKAAWQCAGLSYPGQTELLAERSGVRDFAMMFVGRSPITGWQLRVLLATVHIPLSQVPQVLTPSLILQKLNLLTTTLKQDFGLPQGSIAVAGINPHSGEGGLLGREEVDWLIPTLEAWQAEHHQWQLHFPIPADTLWIAPAQAWHSHQHRGHTAYLAMYHDQGLIPVKMLAFQQAVNMTVGLPFVRTSPDHGTAFDIAGQGVADASSMQAAITLAIELVAARQRHTGERRQLVGTADMA
jgi:4-hydroxythreonine-4-phosphate dehydrogenase